MAPHLLDLVLQRGELHSLAGRGEIGECREDLVDMKCLEPLLNTVGVYHPITPLDTGFEPPRLPAPITLPQLAYIRQAPVPEFGDHHRLTAPAANFGSGLARNGVPRIANVLAPGLDALVDV